MIIPEIVTTVNDDLDTTLNDLLYIMDYKQFGESSGVYQNKDALSKALMTWYAVNDTALRKDAAISANSNDRVGELLAKQYGVDLPGLKAYKTFDSIKNSDNIEILNQFYLANGCFRWLFTDGVLDGSFFVPSVINDFYFGKINGVAPDVAKKFYEAYAVEKSADYDNVKSVYDAGSTWWSWFNNQDWLKEVYDNLTSEYELVRASSSSEPGTINGQAQTGVKAIIHLSASLPGVRVDSATYMVYGKADTVLFEKKMPDSSGSTGVNEYVFIPTDEYRQYFRFGGGGYNSGAYMTCTAEHIADVKKEAAQ